MNKEIKELLRNIKDELRQINSTLEKQYHIMKDKETLEDMARKGYRPMTEDEINKVGKQFYDELKNEGDNE